MLTRSCQRAEKEEPVMVASVSERLRLFDSDRRHILPGSAWQPDKLPLTEGVIVINGPLLDNL